MDAENIVAMVFVCGVALLSIIVCIMCFIVEPIIYKVRQQRQRENAAYVVHQLASGKNKATLFEAREQRGCKDDEKPRDKGGEGENADLCGLHMVAAQKFRPENACGDVIDHRLQRDGDQQNTARARVGVLEVKYLT